MRFSALSHELPGTTNRLYGRVEALRAQNVEILDLIRADPSEAGIVFPSALLDQILVSAAEEARHYRPDPLGQPIAREAVAAYEGISPGHTVLTPGTSVSYGYLFKLLCEAGDEILCPVPSYPLIDYIARLEGVRVRRYRLDERRHWRIDLEDLEGQINQRTRAIAVISPHNPTGMVLDRAQVDALGAIAADHDLPIISDEVFREFTFDSTDAARPAGAEAPLVFTLNGFSKMFALPGLKIGWIAVSGSEALVQRSLATLEMISDTYLPVNEVAQFSVPKVLDQAQEFLSGYRARITACRTTATTALGSTNAVPPAGGFYMVVPYTRDVGEEDLTVELLDEAHMLTHPGYFYEIEGRHIVVSFVNRTETLRNAFPLLKARLDQ